MIQRPCFCLPFHRQYSCKFVGYSLKKGKPIGKINMNLFHKILVKSKID